MELKFRKIENMKNVGSLQNIGTYKTTKGQITERTLQQRVKQAFEDLLKRGYTEEQLDGVEIIRYRN